MAEKEENVQETAVEAVKEPCCGKHKCCITHKLFGLKGLSIIYKCLSVFALLYMVYVLAMLWYYAFKEGAPLAESLSITLQVVVTYGFFALAMITVSRVLKVLKKIKHAVEHK